MALAATFEAAFSARADRLLEGFGLALAVCMFRSWLGARAGHYGIEAMRDASSCGRAVFCVQYAWRVMGGLISRS